METSKQRQDIKGWGADLDPVNRPAYPKERRPARNTGVHWDHLDQQEQNVRILHSNERKGITPVFGTTLPPRGVSGRIRELAFKFTENDIRHWMILLWADRVNMLEGLVNDLQKGHIPNFFKEMGLKTELKYNRKAFVKKTATVVALTGVGILLLRRRRKS